MTERDECELAALTPVAQLPQHAPIIVVCRKIIWCQLRYAFVDGPCLVELARFIQRIGQTSPRVRVLRGRAPVSGAGSVQRGVVRMRQAVERPLVRRAHLQTGQ